MTSKPLVTGHHLAGVRRRARARRRGKAWSPAYSSVGFGEAEYSQILKSTLEMDTLVREHSAMMTIKKMISPAACAMAVAVGLQLSAQVQTDVPPPVPGAKPVSVERITIHGASLEGNLEGNAVDRTGWRTASTSTRARTPAGWRIGSRTT